MNEKRALLIDLSALAKAGVTVGVILYALCGLFYWLFYNAQGHWMIRPFMPGLSTGAAGLLIGLGWAILYGGGILWLLGYFYNHWAR